MFLVLSPGSRHGDFVTLRDLGLAIGRFYVRVR